MVKREIQLISVPTNGNIRLRFLRQGTPSTDQTVEFKRTDTNEDIRGELYEAKVQKTFGLHEQELQELAERVFNKLKPQKGKRK